MFNFWSDVEGWRATGEFLRREMLATVRAFNGFSYFCIGGIGALCVLIWLSR